MSSESPHLSVVLPTYNERDNIVPLIERLSAALAGVSHQLLVMDDRSPDGTAAMAREVMGRYPELQVIERRPPAGLTDSIREGVERSRGHFVVWLDCDLSHPPELVIDLLRPLEAGEADLTAASRYIDGAGDVRDSSFTRLFSLAINTLARFCVHPSVTDYTTGYVMGRRDLILELGLVGDYGEYCIELLGKAALRGLRIREIPYSMISRIAGKSKTVPSLGGFVGRGWRYLHTVCRLVAMRLTGRVGGTPSRNENTG